MKVMIAGDSFILITDKKNRVDKEKLPLKLQKKIGENEAAILCGHKELLLAIEKAKSEVEES